MKIMNQYQSSAQTMSLLAMDLVNGVEQVAGDLDILLFQMP